MTYRPAAFLGLTVAVACLARVACAEPLPTDPFRRSATKALRGDYGTLPTWQADAYRRGLDNGVTADLRLLVTQYNRNEPSGRVDRYGNPCTWRTAASNTLPRKSYVWTETWGLRQVLDCGAQSNTRRAKRAGCDAWLDLWFPSARIAKQRGCDGWTPTRGAVIE